MNGKDSKKGLILRIGFLTLLFILFLVLTIWLFPWFMSFSTKEGQKEIETWISSLGFRGWIVMLGLQILQIIIAVIPGEPIEILLGILYGTWGGFFTCLLGILIGSSIVFGAVRIFGRPFAEAIFGKEKLEHYSFLNNTKKLEWITFILFFIPGTPKDILIYVAGLTKIHPAQFLILSLVARIPSVLSSTWGGASFADGEWGKTILIFMVVGLISVLGVLLHQKLLNCFHKNQ